MKLKTPLLFLSLLCCGTAAAQTTEKVVERLRRKYDYVGPFADSLAVVGRTLSGGFSPTKFGFVNREGKVVVPLEYNFADNFGDETAIVGKGRQGEMKYGLIDRQGRQVAACTWDGVRTMHEGMAVVWNGIAERSYFLVDSLGNAHETEYDFCGDFHGGLAVAGKGEWKAEKDAFMVGPVYRFYGRMGYIDANGEPVIGFEFDDAEDFGPYGLARVAAKDARGATSWGLIDRKGNCVVPFEYRILDPFHNGRAVVGRIVDGRCLYGYIDRFGQEVIPCKYDFAKSFTHANAWVGMLDDKDEYSYMLISVGGQNRLEREVYNLEENPLTGYAVASLPDDTGRMWYGLLDNKGRVILPFEFDSVVIYPQRDTATGEYVVSGQASVGGKTLPFDLRKK